MNTQTQEIPKYTFFDIGLQLPFTNTTEVLQKLDGEDRSEFLEFLQTKFPSFFPEINKVGFGWGYDNEDFDDFNLTVNIEDKDIERYRAVFFEMEREIKDYLTSIGLKYQSLKLSIWS